MSFSLPPNRFESESPRPSPSGSFQPGKRLTPIPPQALIQNLSPSTSDPHHKWIQNDALNHATSTLWSSLNPRPIRILSQEDFDAASQSLGVWEDHATRGFDILSELRGPTGGYLVLDILCALRHAAYACEDTEHDVYSVASRSRVLRRKIFTCLLQEKRNSEHYGNDAGLLIHWMKEINKDLLQLGSLPIHWSMTELPFILDLLESWPLSDLDLKDIQKSNALRVLQSIVEASCVPLVVSSTDPRIRAFELLQVWKAHFDEAMDWDVSPGLDAFSHVIGPPLESRIHEITDILCQFDEHCKYGNSEEVLRISGILKSWRSQLSDHSLKMNIISQVTLSSKGLRDTTSILGEIEAALDMLRTGPDPVPATGFAGFSFHPFSQDHTLSVTFFDITWKSQPSFHDSYAMRPSLGTWDPIVLSSCGTEPLQSLFERFFQESNLRNRHPLFPTKNCSFFLHTDPHIELKLPPGRWAQGTLSSILGETPFPPSLTIAYVRGPECDLTYRSPQVMSLPAWKRILPPGQQTPQHWITPADADNASFTLISSLCFVGSGSEFHPNVTHPPVIANAIWIPKRWEELGLSMWNLRTRSQCQKVAVPEAGRKFVAYLTEEEARRLVGRTVQYAERVTKKIAGQDTQTIEVYHAFIWGFDPARMTLKGFENYQSMEIVRTFLVGREEQTESDVPGKEGLPSDFPPLRLPVRPLWIGLV